MEDVIIIGAGAIGSTIARELSKYNLRIRVLEKNCDICSGTTKANSAIIHGGYDATPGTLKAKFNNIGKNLYPNLSKELGFKYEQLGSLVLGFDLSDEKILLELYKNGIKNGVKDLKIINGDEARKLEPQISQQVTKALYCPSAGIIDPFNYTYSMMENAQVNGVKLNLNSEVKDINYSENSVILKTKDKTYKSKYVINAAGINSSKIANMVGDFDFEIIPTLGLYKLLPKSKEKEIRKILFQTPSSKGKGVLVTKTYAGNNMIGPTSNIINKKLPKLDDLLNSIDNLALKSVPNLNVDRSIREFVGIRAKSNTGDFQIYPSENMKGFIHVGGIESPGLSSAPAIAKYVLRILRLQGLETEEKLNYNIVNRKIKKGDNEIICRCEGVTREEIIEVINRFPEVRNVSGIKRRIRTGMGFCQGNHCGPKIKHILSQKLDVLEEDLDVELTGFEKVENILNKL